MAAMSSLLRPPTKLLYNLFKVDRCIGSEDAQFNLAIQNLRINQGDKIAFIGESGCGKSTLLDILAFIAQPTKSETFNFYLQGQEPINIFSEWEKKQFDPLSQLRKRHIGYVMQTGGLLPYLNVKENILLSRDMLNLTREDDTVNKLISDLKLDRHLTKPPSVLSIGERQRVAIARALAHKPKIVIADEPTASLDPFTAKVVMEIFVNLAEQLNVTLLLASHDWQPLRSFGLHRYYLHTVYSKNLTETSII
jgi:putative ABC transport system ATP-binding protein